MARTLVPEAGRALEPASLGLTADPLDRRRGKDSESVRRRRRQNAEGWVDRHKALAPPSLAAALVDASFLMLLIQPCSRVVLVVVVVVQIEVVAEAVAEAEAEAGSGSPAALVGPAAVAPDPRVECVDECRVRS